jgi:predicted HTH transcriptional regulator
MFLSKTISDARITPQSISLHSLLLENNFDTDKVLRGIIKLSDIFKEYDLELLPSIEENQEDLQLKRVLRLKVSKADIAQEVQSIIDAGGENYKIELKQSVSIDTRKKEFSPGLPLKEYRSEKLELKLAQEMAAFLNAAGGKILIGVKDDTMEVVGCQDDLSLLPNKSSITDMADLIIEKIIKKFLHNSTAVRNHIKIDAGKYNGLPIILLTILPMDQLAFTKDRGGIRQTLYLRSGTSAEPIELSEIEQFYRLTKINPDQ